MGCPSKAAAVRLTGQCHMHVSGIQAKLTSWGHGKHAGCTFAFLGMVEWLCILRAEEIEFFSAAELMCSLSASPELTAYRQGRARSAWIQIAGARTASC
jgi:hypothetical protein